MTILTPVQVAQEARDAGFTGQNLITAVAISFAEDGSHDSGARNLDYSTGDDSWGLWQINTLGRLWADRQALAHQHGATLTSKQQLTDPRFNAEMAYWLWQRRGGFGDWSTYNDRAYLKQWAAAVAAVAHIAAGGPGILTRYLEYVPGLAMLHGPDVATWQGIAGARQDGVFGPLTRADTITWQTHHRDRDGRPLAADGIVGPLTWTAAGGTWEG